MAKSNAERQAAYKARRATGEINDRQLNTWLSSEAFFALQRLATHGELTRKGQLEKLILDADKLATANMNDSEFNAYVDSVTR